MYENTFSNFNESHNKNNLTTYEKDSKTYFAIKSSEIEYDENELWNKMSFEQSTGNSKHQILKEKVSKDG